MRRTRQRQDGTGGGHRDRPRGLRETARGSTGPPPASAYRAGTDPPHRLHGDHRCPRRGGHLRAGPPDHPRDRTPARGGARPPRRPRRRGYPGQGRRRVPAGGVRQPARGRPRHLGVLRPGGPRRLRPGDAATARRRASGQPLQRHEGRRARRRTDRGALRRQLPRRRPGRPGPRNARRTAGERLGADVHTPGRRRAEGLSVHAPAARRGARRGTDDRPGLRRGTGHPHRPVAGHHRGPRPRRSQRGTARGLRAVLRGQLPGGDQRRPHTCLPPLPPGPQRGPGAPPQRRRGRSGDGP